MSLNPKNYFKKWTFHFYQNIRCSWADV